MVKISPSDAAILRYVMYAKHFHWTPAQVDALPLSTDRYLLPVTDILIRLENEASSGP